jgi:hypothetical protein
MARPATDFPAAAAIAAQADAAGRLALRVTPGAHSEAIEIGAGGVRVKCAPSRETALPTKPCSTCSLGRLGRDVKAALVARRNWTRQAGPVAGTERSSALTGLLNAPEAMAIARRSGMAAAPQ